MTPAELLALPAIAILLVAAGFDLVRMEIPDRLPLLLLLLTGGVAILSPEVPILSALGAWSAVLLLGLFLFARGWMGGGDVKLLVALAPMAGLGGLPTLLAAIAVSGGLLALALLLARAGVRGWMGDGGPHPLVLKAGAPLPYAVAIALGGGAWAWLSGRLPF